MMSMHLYCDIFLKRVFYFFKRNRQTVYFKRKIICSFLNIPCNSLDVFFFSAITSELEAVIYRHLVGAIYNISKITSDINDKAMAPALYM